ncbi:hypothetical protein QG37_08117 [Candidozyma auris]|uniref:Uncharacterized protein n=1 Tax=Candidozyma auris TaxID=498019 RepID=A0A0L0NNG3_CANAR|nr:hypothetical protein QG37_08117 [[Candida] auris]
MYISSVAAEETNTRMQPLMTWSILVMALKIAMTNHEAEAIQPSVPKSLESL